MKCLYFECKGVCRKGYMYVYKEGVWEVGKDKEILCGSLKGDEKYSW